MPLSSVTGDQVIRRVRLMTQQFGVDKVGPQDILSAINMKQQDLFLAMNEQMQEEWYGKRDSAAQNPSNDPIIGYPYIEMPSDCNYVLTIKEIWTESVSLYTRDVIRVDPKSAEEFRVNSFIDQTGFFVLGHEPDGENGARIYLVSGESLALASRNYVVVYVRQPADLSDSSSDYMDLPPTFSTLLATEVALIVVMASNIDAQAKQVAVQSMAFTIQEQRKLLGLPVPPEQEEHERMEKIGQLLGGEGAGQSRSAYSMS